MAKKKSTVKVKTTKVVSRYRSISAKIRFGHKLTQEDRNYITEHPEFDWGPGSGSDLPNKTKNPAPRTRKGLLTTLREVNKEQNQIASDLLKFGFGWKIGQK